MNDKLQTIAAKYSVAFDQIPAILEGLKVKDVYNLSDKQLEGFECVCILLEEKQTLDDAISTVVEQAINETPSDESFLQSEPQTTTIEQNEDNHETDIEQTTTEQPQLELPQPKADQTAKSNPTMDLKQLGMTDEQIAFLSEQQVQGLIQTLAMVGYAERQRVIAKFLEMSRQRLDQALKSPEVVQQFQNVFTSDIVPPHLLEGMPKIQFTLPGN